MNKSIQFAAFVTFAATLAQLSACTWVKPTVSAEAVRVAYDGNVSGCRDVGTVSVSVTDKVAFYHRPDLKVRDELETLARNQAAGIPADTIKPTDEPKNGAQNFQAYVCGGVHMKQRDAAAPANAASTKAAPTKDDVQTFPVKDH